jgi:hypothetical protein
MYSLIASGQIPSIRIGSSVRVPLDELHKRIAAHTRPVVPPQEQYTAQRGLSAINCQARQLIARSDKLWRSGGGVERVVSVRRRGCEAWPSIVCQNLGRDKFTKICNALARGTPALTLARLIQQEWRDAQKVGESTLVKQLLRLHTAITNAAFGGELAQLARETTSVTIKRFHGSTSTCRRFDSTWASTSIAADSHP